jgi:hypothetical protein
MPPVRDTVTPMRRLLLAVLALALLPASASAAPPAPFGHACTAQNGVRFCPATALTDRVASFDGVPLDVDVTLPATGDGPFPTIVMLHGYGGDKTKLRGVQAGGRPAAFERPRERHDLPLELQRLRAGRLRRGQHDGARVRALLRRAELAHA